MGRIKRKHLTHQTAMATSEMGAARTGQARYQGWLEVSPTSLASLLPPCLPIHSKGVSEAGEGPPGSNLGRVEATLIKSLWVASP